MKGTKKDIYSFFQNGQNTIRNLENKINKLEQDLKLKNNESDDFDFDDFNDISKKMNNIYEEIKEVKEKINRYPFILEKGEKLMSIIISSRDEKMLYSLPCKNNNTINDIEKKLYREFPEYYDNKNIFLYKGKIINKFETFQKNNIKNGDILILELADNLNLGFKNIKKNELNNYEDILKYEIEKLKKENALLRVGINGDLEKINLLKKIGYEGNDLKEENPF